ncbi:porphobilinogen synthase [Paraoerskovia marina]|uniref:Delta-aminolevulinic acid dehydratase n=1 Tax=Paraoerskovia marina TaxID=545619 RepID=A0A1H1M370_9CELL|nr:porphobilinogen synthase [Paraoerskovia marina]SDR81221.1 porphobilinogen synthase [Paraoerskovia marina]
MIDRPRRLRTTPAMRRMVAETRLHPADLVLPLFVREDLDAPQPITSMPGQVQHTEATLADAVRAACAAGIAGVMLFGIPAHKDATGSAGDDPDGILNRGVRIARRVSDEAVAAGGTGVVVMADTCLDEFTDHGHCGVLDDAGRVDNDATLDRYAALAVAQTRAGADVVAPSGMMDGQVAVIREALDAAGFTDVSILAYSAKYASAFYGPFREAVDSSLTGDRRTYQMDAGNGREGLREADLDLAEGADLVMVKPAGSYLDVLADVAARSDVPVAAYQVSGEYAMIEAAAAHGWIDRRSAVLESLVGIRRAGASIVLTYWALEAADWIRA